MLLEIYSKNFELMKKIRVDSVTIPRTGETITLEDEEFDGESELLIHNITHVLKDNMLTPVVSCHARSGSDNRRFILREHGWF